MFSFLLFLLILEYILLDKHVVRLMLHNSKFCQHLQRQELQRAVDEVMLVANIKLIIEHNSKFTVW